MQTDHKGLLKDIEHLTKKYKDMKGLPSADAILRLCAYVETQIAAQKGKT